MCNRSVWFKWRRQGLALVFVLQYHCRMFLLGLRYRLHRISQEENETQAQAHRRKLHQALLAHQALTGVWQTVKKSLETESVTAALQVVKKGLEHESITTTLRVVKKGLEHESVTSTLKAVKRGLDGRTITTSLQTARQKIERIVLVEDEPTQELSIKVQKTWQATRTALRETNTGRFCAAWLQAARKAHRQSRPVILARQTHQTVQRGLRQIRSGKRNRLTAWTLGGAALLLVILFVQIGLFKNQNPALQSLQTLGFTVVRQVGVTGFNLNMLAQHQASTAKASKALVRISQLDAGQYSSTSDYDTWAYSACSAAALTEVFNAYNRHYTIADVLKVEKSIGAITPELGLTSNEGIARTAAKFGFQTDWGNNWTLDQVLNNANAGRPVIIGWPPARYDGGHIVVVVGGDANHIYLADSSLWNRQVLSRSQFMQWWGGFAAVITPAA